MNIRGSVNMVRFCEPAWNNLDERIVRMLLITYIGKSP